jgi:hypothetical protein
MMCRFTLSNKCIRDIAPIPIIAQVWVTANELFVAANPKKDENVILAATEIPNISLLLDEIPISMLYIAAAKVSDFSVIEWF